MGKPIFLLLGGNKLNRGVFDKFHRQGWSVFVVDWNEHPNLCGDRHYQIDVKDTDAIVQALKADGVFSSVKVAYSSIDLAVPNVAAINKAIGLQVIGADGLAHSSSKGLMTRRWKEAGLLNREAHQYQEYSSDIETFASRMDIIIKPDNSASSRGITVLPKGSSPADVSAAFNKAKEEATDNEVVVEEFVHGTEFTVEMLGDGRGAVAVYAISKKYHTTNAGRNKVAVKLHYNAVDRDLQEKIAAHAIKCYQALGFTNSMGHLEILLKEDGTLSPVEIGARSSGFICADLVEVASGRDFFGDWMRVMRGEQIEPGLVPQTTKSSMFYFYDPPAHSVIREQRSLTEFLPPGISSRYSDISLLIPGTKIGPISSDNARIGFEILEGERNILTIETVLAAEERMYKAILKS